MASAGRIEAAVQDTNIWLKEMAEEDPSFDDRDRAFTCLRAVLQTLRDRLTVEEAVQLGAQLPTLVRGVYYGSWNPRRQPTGEREVEEFLGAVSAHLSGGVNVAPETAARTVFHVLRRHVGEGEINEVIHMLPKPVQQLWQ